MSVSFLAGALYSGGDPDSLPAALRAASELLTAARRGDPPPQCMPWRELAQSMDTDAEREQAADLIAAVEAAESPVVSVLAARHRLRAAVLDGWAARLYAPPVDVAPSQLASAVAMVAGVECPPPTRPSYVLSTMLAELQAVLAAAGEDHQVASELQRSCLAALAAALSGTTTNASRQAAILGFTAAASRAAAQLGYHAHHL
jgi:hypothetical protein